MLRLRSLRSATWKHPILTFDLTLTWHVTLILNFRKWFGSVSSRSFECRLVRLSTSIRFRDSRGGGRIRPPQAVVGTETAQAVAGYRSWDRWGGGAWYAPLQTVRFSHPSQVHMLIWAWGSHAHVKNQHFPWITFFHELVLFLQKNVCLLDLQSSQRPHTLPINQWLAGVQNNLTWFADEFTCMLHTLHSDITLIETND